MVTFSMVSIGNAEFLQSIFNSVAMIFGTGDMKQAIAVCFLLGIFIISVQAIFQGVRGIAYQNIFIGMILYLCFFSIPSRILIEDLYTGEQPVVENVPIGVSASASIISQMTYGLTDLMTTAFGDADRITQLPFASSLKYMMAITDGISTTKMIETLQKNVEFEIKPTMTEFLRECIVQKNYAQNKSLANLKTMKVTEIINLANDAQALTVGYHNKHTNTVESKTCPEVAQAINTHVIKKINSEDMRKELLGMAGYSTTKNLAVADGLDTSTALSALGLYAVDAQNLMTAAMVEPMLKRAAKQFYTKREALADAMVTQAKHQRNIQWGAEQSMWMSVAHPIMTFFEGFIFAITPFMACLIAFGTYGLGLIGKYLQTLLWIGLWMPLMAIVNLYINMAARGELAAKIGDHCPMESICGIDTLDQVLETQLGVGGMLAAATPMLALMIVTGSTFAFTSIASRLNGADHIDEKMVAPDGMKVAPAYEVTSQTTRDPANGEHKTGAESMIPTITYEYGTKTTVSSKRSTTQADQDNYAKSLGQVDQQITQGGKTEIFNEAQQRNLSSILSKSDSAAIQQRRDWAETHNAMGLLSTSLGATAGLSVEKALAMMKDSPFEAAFRADMKAQAQKGISTAKAIGLNASDITSMQAAHANSVASTIQQGNNIDFSIKDGQTIASNLQQVASRLESDSRSFDQMAGEEGGVKMQSTANVAQVAEAVMGLEDKTNRTDEENAILANVHGAMSYGNQNYGREIEQKAAAYQRSFGMTARAARIAATAGVLYDHREKDQVNAVCSPLSPISTSTGSTVTDSRQYSGNYAPNNAGVKEEVKNETDDIDQLTGRGKENAQYWADYIIGAKYGFNTMKLPGEEEVDKHHKAAQQEVSVVIDQNNAAVDAKGEPTIETAFDHVFSALGVKEYAPYIARAFGATETGLTVKVPEVPSTPSSSGKNFIPEKQGTKQK